MPLEQKVYTDSLDVDLRINGDEWFLLNCRVELSRASTPDYVDMIIGPSQEALNNLPNQPGKPLSEGGILGAEFTLDVDTQLVGGPRGQTEVTRLFTGQLANLSTAAQGAWEAIAFDPSHHKFKEEDDQTKEASFLNTKINVSTVETKEIKANSSIPTGVQRIAFSDEAGAPPGTFIQASVLAQEIIKQAGFTVGDDAFIHMEEGGVLIGTHPDGTEITAGRDKLLYFAEPQITIGDALERIRNSTLSEWWFDRFGDFHIGAVAPGQPADSHTLQFIIDTSAGMSTPPWQSVQVIGSGVVSENGWDATNLTPSEKVERKMTLATDGKTDTGELSEPVFTYRNLEIQSQAEATDVAQAVIEKLRDQQASGTVDVVGFPEIRPFDAIEMPDSQLQPMGGERFGVVKVVHNLNPSDGFITTIHVGGLTRNTATLFNEEIKLSRYARGPDRTVERGSGASASEGSSTTTVSGPRAERQR